MLNVQADTEEEWFNTERIRDNAGEWLEAEFPDISDDSTLQSLDSTIARASNLKRRINNIRAILERLGDCSYQENLNTDSGIEEVNHYTPVPDNSCQNPTLDTVLSRS